MKMCSKLFCSFQGLVSNHMPSIHSMGDRWTTGNPLVEKVIGEKSNWKNKKEQLPFLQPACVSEALYTLLFNPNNIMN